MSQYPKFPPPPPPLPPPLPPGWVIATDPAGRIYFANLVSGQTSWEPPVMVPPPPPPPRSTPFFNNKYTAAPISIPNNSSTPQVHAKMIPAHLIGSQSSTTTSTSTAQHTASISPAVTVTNTGISTAASALLVPVTRALINKQLSCALDRNSRLQLEFTELSAGTIADLVHVQAEWRVDAFQSLQQRQTNNDGEDDEDLYYKEDEQQFRKK